MFKLKELMEYVSNQPPAKHSSTFHVCHVLVCLTNSSLTSITFSSVINSASKGKMDEQAGKGRNLEKQRLEFQLMGGLQTLLESPKKHEITSIEKGDRADEGNSYRGLVIAYFSLGDLRKAIEYNEKQLKIAIETGDRAGEGSPFSGPITDFYCNFQLFFMILNGFLEVTQ